MRHLLLLDADDPASAASRAARETLARVARKVVPGGVRCTAASAGGQAAGSEVAVALVSGGARGAERLASLLSALPEGALLGKAVLPVFVAGRPAGRDAETLTAALRARGAAVFEPVTLDPAQVYAEHGGLYKVASPEFEAGLRAGLVAMLTPADGTVH